MYAGTIFLYYDYIQFLNFSRLIIFKKKSKEVHRTPFYLWGSMKYPPSSGKVAVFTACPIIKPTAYQNQKLFLQ